jgi:pyruvate kinase
MRRAKIICTIGPASGETETLEELIEAGMDVARLNFSHGTHEEHARTVERVREAARRRGKTVGIMQDLQGPKIRTGTMEGGSAELKEGEEFIITTDDIGDGNARRVSTTYAQLASDVRPGNRILLDDGYLALKVTSVEGNDVHTVVEEGGTLKDHKGIVLPGVPISAPALSEKDLDDLRFGIGLGVDVVALSFVRSERDVIQLRDAMHEYGRVLPVIAKIERYEGLEDIDDIVREAQGIMVARGDLGLEMPAEEVPVLQKHIIRTCNHYGRPVITATQMLESMIHNPLPTRAEASDVANAVLDGSDAVMLSAETSVGRYPVQAVRYMDRIVRAIEKDRPDSTALRRDVPTDHRSNVSDAIGRAACVIAEQIGAAAIVPLTTSGGTARAVAKYRPRTPIIAVTDHEHTLRRMAFIWGVTPLLIPPLDSIGYRLEALDDVLLSSGLLKPGDTVVYSAGSPLRERASTNMLEVHRLNADSAD